MATQVSQISDETPARSASWPWFREFIRWEIAPYPGRLSTVIRMTITATLVMFVAMTFRIPYAFLGGLYSILLARENLIATWRAGQMIVLAFVAATLYSLLGMMLFRGYPITHFFWVIASLYLVFFVIRAANNYAAALVFAVPIGVAMPIWDRSVSSEIQVEGTLWLVLIIAVGAGVAVATEAVYRIFDRSDPLISSIDDMLLAVQMVTENIAAGHLPPKSVMNRVLQYQMTGTGRLRITLQRQGVEPTRRAQRSALISLTGRIIGLAADLESIPANPSDEDAMRLRALSERLRAIRMELRTSGGISISRPVLEGQPSACYPMLQGMEQTVALITEVSHRDEALDKVGGAAKRDWWRALFLPDAFQNPEYQRFALGGCLAASSCYILYNALDWPGIGTTAVLTCIVTALTTIGNSLQMQFLRLAGFVVGGIVLGISAQILILPGIDSVFGFALLFAAVTAIAAWFATSSPRLSYFGLQIALAFYFVNLQDFHIVTDLMIARDKVVGVLLGILAMGFVFDRFGVRSGEEQLQALLVKNVRLLAQLVADIAPLHEAINASRISWLRSQINENFAKLESLTDAVRFEYEFRHRRAKDAAECVRIQRVQPWLRSIYLLELSLLSHRGRGADTEITEQQNQALDDLLDEYGDKLTHIAAWIAHKEDAPAPIGDDSVRLLRRAFEMQASPNSRAIDVICQKMIASFLMLRSEC